jgi:hypothetical protein
LLDTNYAIAIQQSGLLERGKKPLYSRGKIKMKRSISLLVILLVMFFIACNFVRLLPENTITPTPLKHRATTLASPTPASMRPTVMPPAHPPVPIVYYYFVAIKSNTIPAGSVVILPDVLILGPTLSKIPRSLDPVTNISSALQAMINDPRNEWTSNDLGISSVAFRDGTANVVLHGKIFGAGDMVLIAAREQILLTVFAEDSVQTATITLNGESIANLGISHSSEAKPADYTYTRAEIETFMTENAYGK